MGKMWVIRNARITRLWGYWEGVIVSQTFFNMCKNSLLAGKANGIFFIWKGHFAKPAFILEIPRILTNFLEYQIMARKQFNYVVDGNSVTVQRLTYADLDAPAEIAEEVTFQVADVPAELTSGEAVVSLASYGLSQLLQDRVSSVAAEGKMEAMQAVYEMLKEGQWKAQRESTGGERKATIDSFFATGFALFLQSKGKDVDATVATAMLQGMSADERKAVRAADQVKPFIQKAKDQAAAQAADIDLESLLG